MQSQNSNPIENELITDESIQRLDDGVTLSEKDVAEINSYLMGTSTDVPHKIERMMTSIVQKVSISLSAQIVQNVNRSQNLIQALQALEENILLEENLQNLTQEEKIELHKSLHKQQMDMMELQRKFLVQTKDHTNKSQTAVELIAQKLLKLPEEEYQKIVKTIEGQSE